MGKFHGTFPADVERDPLSAEISIVTSPPGAGKTIGRLEVLAVLGQILPAALGIFPAPVPLATSCLPDITAGIAITNPCRQGTSMVGINKNETSGTSVRYYISERIGSQAKKLDVVYCYRSRTEPPANSILLPAT